ncbi:hypothetical protein WDZ11_00235 (plasmid) [Roseomonas mucosa]|uniref:hypothetical protein n=1 Tax=Roseomonas mucosa TaxID=207340 RepID=UPI0030CFF77F
MPKPAAASKRVKPTRPARLTWRNDPRQPDLLRWQPRRILGPLAKADRAVLKRFTGAQIWRACPEKAALVILGDRLDEVTRDAGLKPEQQALVALVKQLLLDATWAYAFGDDARRSTRPDACRERDERESDREDAIEWFAGRRTGWSLEQVCDDLDWDAGILRRAAHERIRERSPWHAATLDEAIAHYARPRRPMPTPASR